MADASKYFGLSCPNGGNFYICENNATEFIGCCTTNPCTPESNGECLKANLRAASFLADKYADLPRQDCDDADSIKIWYTCAYTHPPFLGCCASNPCAAGLCTSTDLRPAKLSGDAEFKAQFLHPAGLVTSTTSLSAGAIGGICAAAAVVLIMIVGIIIWYARRKRQKQKLAAQIPPAPSPASFVDETGERLPVAWNNGYRPRGESNVSGATAFGDGMSSYKYQSPLLGRQYSPGFDPPYGRDRDTSFPQEVPCNPAPKVPVELPSVETPIPELPTYGRGTDY